MASTVVCDRAARVLGATGWLSRQPEAFRETVLRRSVQVRFAAGKTVYEVGDPLGGVYGIVSGAVTVTTGPRMAVPRLFHVGGPGSWIGEG